MTGHSWQITKNKDMIEFRLLQDGEVIVELLRVTPEEAKQMASQFHIAANLAISWAIQNPNKSSLITRPE